MITSCNHSENIICGSCLMKNHQEKQVAENLLRGELQDGRCRIWKRLCSGGYILRCNMRTRIKPYTKHLSKNAENWKH